MSERRHDRLETSYQKLAASFLESVSDSKESLITVIHCSINDSLRKAIVYIRVFPETHRDKALLFANRRAKEFRMYVAEQSRGRFVPEFEFLIDPAQRIEELL